jgi:tetratricopeptide (TPR) repeat protein
MFFGNGDPPVNVADKRQRRRVKRLIALGLCLFGSGVYAVVLIAQWRCSNCSNEPFFPGLGNHSRKVTTSSPIAQRYFDQGFAFLSGFNHDEALRSFDAAAANDPDCAMAYWGIAMAHGCDLNRVDISKAHGSAAWKALATACRLAPTATEVERALIEALCDRYDDPAPDDQRGLNEAYANAMLQVHSAFPQDSDVGALTVEALLISGAKLPPLSAGVDGQKPKIIEILDRVLANDPQHPLGLHMLVHACENSDWRERARTAALVLRDLNPGLGHLLHMPSHMDVRFGDWHEAVAANEKAVAADLAYARIARPTDRYRRYVNHNYHMLAFAAMMCGQSDKALQATQEIVARISEQHSGGRAGKLDGYVALPFEVFIRFGRWDMILDQPEPAASCPMDRALRRYARAVAYAAKRNVQLAKLEERAFAAARLAVPTTATYRNSNAQDILGIAEKMLAGEILYREYRISEAVAALQEAITREDNLPKSDPPDWIFPVRHALGATLMDAGRYAEAELVYREDLVHYPENGWSLYGLSQCLVKQGKKAEAILVKARLDKTWAGADFKLRSSCCCLASSEKSTSN